MQFLGKEAIVREEQQKDRDRVTRRGGTKMFGSAAAPKSAERIRAFDEDREYAERETSRSQRRAEDVRDDRRYREDDPESKNSRIDQLLRNLGVSDLEDADWAMVNSNLTTKAEAAKAWLKDAITQATP